MKTKTLLLPATMRRKQKSLTVQNEKILYIYGNKTEFWKTIRSEKITKRN